MIHEMLPATNDRVTQNTSASVNEKIRSETLAKIDYYRVHKNEIDKRLEELEREWDTERFLEANASTLAMIGVALGFTTQNKKWFILPGVVATFLFQHALQGWCPPLPIIRRLGFRTAKEINEEKLALKCLKDDAESVCRTTLA